MKKGPIQKILLPIELPRRDTALVDYAISLAEQLGAEICFFAVIDSPTTLYLIKSKPSEHKRGEGFHQKVVDDAKVLIRRLVDRATDRGVRAMGHAVVSERTDKEILREAEERGSDVILFGDQSHGLLYRMFFGDTADAVLERAPCPVLVVKSDL